MRPLAPPASNTDRIGTPKATGCPDTAALARLATLVEQFAAT